MSPFYILDDVATVKGVMRYTGTSSVSRSQDGQEPPSPTWQCPLQERTGPWSWTFRPKGHKQLLTHGQNHPHSTMKARGREVPFYPVSGERAGAT